MNKLNSFAIVIILLTSFIYSADVLRGSGATFPYPLYKAWLKEYQKNHGTRIDYAPTGSGDGIRQLLLKKKDFGGTDVFIDSIIPQDKIIHIPTCLGAIVIIYNLPSIRELKLTPSILASIFLGKIKNWNHKDIARINTDDLPDKPITLIHRSDLSGSTFIFTDYLCRINSKWQKEIGRSKKVRWPKGIGAKGNPGIAEYVNKIPGSIGYVELTYAHMNKQPIALLKNKSGNWIKPTLESVSAAADIALPSDMRIMITNTSSPKGYPISAFTYFICYKNQNYGNRSFSKGKSLVDFLMWSVTEGQTFTSKYHYAPLSPKAVQRAKSIIHTIHFNNNSFIDNLQGQNEK